MSFRRKVTKPIKVARKKVSNRVRPTKLPEGIEINEMSISHENGRAYHVRTFDTYKGYNIRNDLDEYIKAKGAKDYDIDEDSQIWGTTYTIFIYDPQVEL